MGEDAKAVAKFAVEPEDERSEISIEYAGLHGVAVRFIGKDHATF